jgi:hypothetical protein
MKEKIIYAIIIIALLLSLQDIYPQVAVKRCVFGSGGVLSETNNYKLSGTLGQTLIGEVINTDLQTMNGFWYQVNATITSVESNPEELPAEFSLQQNYPNPFNPATTIKYSIPVVESRDVVPVKLILYDILGNEVVTFVNEEQRPGIYEIVFHASNLASGIYIYRLTTEGFVQSKKLVLMK